MNSLSSTVAVVAEDQYRRERAMREIHSGARSHHTRFATWRERRRTGRATGR